MPSRQKRPNHIDIYVGSRVRSRRNALGMSQKKLAGNLEMSFQQVQKYETGANRISASRLQAIAEALDVTPSFFFEGAADVLPNEVGEGVDAADALTEFVKSTEGFALNMAFAKIGDAEIRRGLVNLVKALGHDERDL